MEGSQYVGACLTASAARTPSLALRAGIESRKRDPSPARFGVALTSRGRVWNTSPKRKRGGPDRPGVTRTTWRALNTSAPVFLRALAQTPSLALRAGIKPPGSERTPRRRVLVLRSPVVVGSGIQARSASEGVRIGRDVTRTTWRSLNTSAPVLLRALAQTPSLALRAGMNGSRPLAGAFWCCAHQSWSGLEYQPEAQARGSGSAGCDADNMEGSQYVGACLTASARADPLAGASGWYKAPGSEGPLAGSRGVALTRSRV